MNIEVMLVREFRTAAEQVVVPPPPPRPQSTSTRPWVPLLVAAAVALIVAGAATLVARSERSGNPAPSHSPTRPSTTAPTEAATQVPTTSPAAWAMIVAHRLYVDGEQVPGTWDRVGWSGHTWVAVAAAGTSSEHYYWGTGAHAQRLPEADVPTDTVLQSQSGRFVAYVPSDGSLRLLDVETGRVSRSDGFYKGFDRPYLVTNDGVVLFGDPQRAWVPADRAVRDLTPYEGVRALSGEFAIVVRWETSRCCVLAATLDEHGRLRIVADLRHGIGDDIYARAASFAISPDGTWLVENAPGPGPEDNGPALEVRRLTGGPITATLSTPRGWMFTDLGPTAPGATDGVAWETDDQFLAFVDMGRAVRRARCSISLETCVLVDGR